jgi:hypothetical protein
LICAIAGTVREDLQRFAAEHECVIHPVSTPAPPRGSSRSAVSFEKLGFAELDGTGVDWLGLKTGQAAGQNRATGESQSRLVLVVHLGAEMAA